MVVIRRTAKASPFLALALALLAPAAPANAAAVEASPLVTSQADAALDRIFAEDERDGAPLDPVGGLERGDPVEAADLARLYTDDLLQRRRALSQRTLAALDRIDPATLSPDHRLSYETFRALKRTEAEDLSPATQALTAVMPFSHFGGFHIEYSGLASGAGAIPLDTVADHEANLARNRAFAIAMDNAIARFEQGLASGTVEPRVTVRNMIAQIDGLLAQPVEASPFHGPALRLPDGLPAPERTRLSAAYRASVRDDLYPAYRRLRAFLAERYLPAARASEGLSALPGGAALYRQLIRQHTTLDVDPRVIHGLGLAEVARIQREMEAVKRELGFAGKLPAFFEYMRTAPRFHPRSADELAEGFRNVGEAVAAQTPRYFITVPRTPLEIQAYPEFRAKFEAGGSYDQGSADGTRPGVFFYNTYDLPSRFLTGITTLYLHEAAPGHHFQISLAQENTKLPDFQRFGGNTAFVEGWALYAETLGYAMGFYKDPAQHWGTLDDEMLRAMRLVVDTGIHTKGWSRERAIAYMLANSGMGRSDATAEVERYIANPGQALAYKIGALTIQRLRRNAERALGARFDIRRFHEQVLGSGALPLPVLEGKIEGWIARGGA